MADETGRPKDPRDSSEDSASPRAQDSTSNDPSKLEESPTVVSSADGPSSITRVDKDGVGVPGSSKIEATPVSQVNADRVSGLSSATSDVAGSLSPGASAAAPFPVSAGPANPEGLSTGGSPMVGEPKTDHLWAVPSGPRAPSATDKEPFVPPVDPPKPQGLTPQPVVAQSVGENNAQPARWGWRALVSFLAGAMVMSGGYVTNAWLNGGSPTVARAEQVTSSAAEPTTEINTELGENAAAGVARVLGPAVVQVETDVGLGSGVIYGDGLIVTNAHVLAGAEQVRVRLADGRTLPAEIIGSAVNVDVAVVSVGEGEDLPIAQLATDDSVVVGQQAIAIGSPFELQQTVTQGIVSAVARPVTDPRTKNITAMIQTDASINPGNSGGALADVEGRVVGINTAIQTDGSAGSVGVGFAIPIDTVMDAADRLVAGEPLESGLLGITGGPTTDGSAGVQVREVSPGSGAEQAGIVPGDRILSIDGAPVRQSDELAGLIVAHPPGDIIVLEVQRGSETLKVEVTLGAK